MSMRSAAQEAQGEGAEAEEGSAAAPAAAAPIAGAAAAPMDGRLDASAASVNPAVPEPKEPEHAAQQESGQRTGAVEVMPANTQEPVGLVDEQMSEAAVHAPDRDDAPEQLLEQQAADSAPMEA